MLHKGFDFFAGLIAGNTKKLAKREHTMCIRPSPFFFLLVFLALASINPRYSFSEEPKHPRELTRNERILPEINVAGELLVQGVMVNPADQPRAKAFHVFLPPAEGDSNQRRLCISAVTVDGVYVCEIQYDIASVLSQTYSLTLTKEPKAVNLIDRYGKEELVVAGRVADDCTDPLAGQYVLTSWSEDALAKPKLISVFVRSLGRMARIIVPTIDGTLRRSFSCRHLTIKKTPRVYDQRCDIPIADQLDTENAWVEIWEGRRRLSDQLISIKSMRP